MKNDEKLERPEGDEEVKSQGWLTTKRRVSIAVGILVIVAIALMLVNQLVKSKATDKVAVAGVVQSIEITTPGSVTLTDAPSGLTVTRTANYVFKKPNVTDKVKDSVLFLTADCGGFRIGGCSAGYSVAVPANIAVTVKKSSGVSIKGVKSDVTVAVKAASVSLNSSYGRIDVQTTGGAVTGTAISSRDLRVRTGNGAINLRFAAAPSNVDAQSQQGAITVQVPKSSTSYNVDASSQTGKTTTEVNRDANSPFSLIARSESGAVTVEAK